MSLFALLLLAAPPNVPAYLPVAPESFFSTCFPLASHLYCSPDGSESQPGKGTTFAVIEFSTGERQANAKPFVDRFVSDHPGAVTEGPRPVLVDGREGLQWIVQQGDAPVGFVVVAAAGGEGPRQRVITCAPARATWGEPLCRRGLGLVAAKGIPEKIPVTSLNILGKSLPIEAACSVARSSPSSAYVVCPDFEFSYDVGLYETGHSRNHFRCAVLGQEGRCSFESARHLGFPSNVRASLPLDDGRIVNVGCLLRRAFNPTAPRLPGLCGALVSAPAKK
jgi:hypothetical protein